MIAVTVIPTEKLRGEQFHRRRHGRRQFVLSVPVREPKNRERRPALKVGILSRYEVCLYPLENGDVVYTTDMLYAPTSPHVVDNDLTATI